MKITLIEPGFQRETLLAGITPPDVEVEALDDRIEEIDYEAPRDLVGISVKTFTARRAYQIAVEFRKRGVPVILGGHHPTLLPKEEQMRFGKALGAF